MSEVIRDSHRFRALARVRQDTEYYCGPAAVQMLLSHFGIEKDQEQIVDAAEVRKTVAAKGMSVEQMAKAVKSMAPEMAFWVKRESGVKDLVKMVREYNYPVGVDWQGIFLDGFELDQDRPKRLGKGGGSGHYSVVIDVDETNDYIRIADPYGKFSGKDRFFGIKEFVKRWWDERTDKGLRGTKKYIFEKKLMFIVLPGNLKFPLELGMTKL